jgi:hypothetical protein
MGDLRENLKKRCPQLRHRNGNKANFEKTASRKPRLRDWRTSRHPQPGQRGIGLTTDGTTGSAAVSNCSPAPMLMSCRPPSVPIVRFTQYGKGALQA